MSRGSIKEENVSIGLLVQFFLLISQLQLKGLYFEKLTYFAPRLFFFFAHCHSYVHRLLANEVQNSLIQYAFQF